MIRYNYYCILLASVAFYHISNIDANPISEKTSSILNEEVPLVAEAKEMESEFSSSSKGGPPYPMSFAPFFTNNKPTTTGNSAVNGEVQGIYANNNTTLISYANGPNPAIASLHSEAYYQAQPVSETVEEELPDGSTMLNTMAGFNVIAVEQTQAFAQGDHITFINHGGSSATGFGESVADAETINPGPGTTGWSKQQ
ncbi:unnamed protein product [Orchesella dallaii]|uniref:Uncharacterized protein n=1 Tax=Orchesella dallaii TaxID=48710 RepID=A0ABP1Q648_9HEXA